MKLVVDKNKCIGCGSCVAQYSDTFAFDSDGLSMVISDKIPDDIENITRICPTYAIVAKDCECNNGECKCQNKKD